MPGRVENKKENLEREMLLREAELEERKLSRQSQTALFQSQQDFFANMQLQQQQLIHGPNATTKFTNAFCYERCV